MSVGLVSQARRAAYSIAANIVEGSAKRGSREFRRYLDMSIGSLSELDYALVVARDLGYLPLEDWERLEKMCAEAAKVVWGLYRSMAAASWPPR